MLAARGLAAGMAARTAVLTAAALGALALAASPALAAPNEPPVHHFADDLTPPDTDPVVQTINEDTPVTFSAANSNQISITDADADPDDLRVTLNAAFGRITIATGSGVGFWGGGGGDNNGFGDTETRIQGTLGELNAALNGMTFAPNAHHNNDFGTATLTIFTDDQGNNGDGGGQTDTDVVTFDITPVAEPPQVSVPAGVGTFRGVARELSLANLNSLTVDEPDDDIPVMMELELSTANGTLTLADTAGLTPSGGANGGATMSFTGTDASFTGALNAGLTFTPNPGFTGDATITAEATDLDGSDVFVTDVRVDAPGDMVFWTASKNTFDPPNVPVTVPAGLGRAFLDGTGGANLVTGPELQDTPGGVAIDAVEGRIYWKNPGADVNAEVGIWSANLDGTDKQIFLTPAQATAAGTKLDGVNNMAIDQETRRIYWANNGVPAVKGISYVSLDAAPGTPMSGGVVDTDPEDDGGAASVSNPRGLALDLEHDRVYWTNTSGPASISFAPLPGASGTAGNFAVTPTMPAQVNQPNGVAVDLDSDPERLFWTNGTGTADETERLKVAEIPEPFDPNIMSSAFDITPNPGGGLRTPAIDPVAGHIYWANSSSDMISYADLGGAGNADNLDIGTAFTNSPDGVTILRAPEAVSAPSISGTPQAGSALSCAGGTWLPDQPNAGLYRTGASTFVWTRDGVAIAGATGASYVPTAAGEHRCTQTVTNFAGASAQSSGTVTVAPAPVTATPAPVADDPCAALRKQLKKAKSKKKRKKLRRKLQKNGC